MSPVAVIEGIDKLLSNLTTLQGKGTWVLGDIVQKDISRRLSCLVWSILVDGLKGPKR